MFTVLNAFWRIALLRLGPDDLPDSGVLLAAALACYAAVDGVVIAGLYPAGAWLPLLLADVGLLAVCCGVTLALFGLPGRLRRTLTALAGAGAVLQALALPFSVLLPADAVFVRVFGLLVILLWSVGVYGYVFARALSRSLAVGVTLAVVYFFLSFELVRRVAPVD